MLVPPVIRPPRPTGVAILTILQIIVGVVDILTGALLLAVYALAATVFGVELSGAFGVFMLPLALLSFVFGVFSFILAYGLWTGRGWAWISSIIIAVIGLAVGIMGLAFGSFANLIPIVFYALILVYLSTNPVRAFFGRGLRLPSPRVAPTAPTTPVYQTYPPYAQPQVPQMGYQQAPIPQTQVQAPYYPQPYQPAFQQPGWRPSNCPSCGTPVTPEANYCDRCGARLR